MLFTAIIVLTLCGPSISQNHVGQTEVVNKWMEPGCNSCSASLMLQLDEVGSDRAYASRTLQDGLSTDVLSEQLAKLNLLVVGHRAAFERVQRDLAKPLTTFRRLIPNISREDGMPQVETIVSVLDSLEADLRAKLDGHGNSIGIGELVSVGQWEKQDSSLENNRVHAESSANKLGKPWIELLEGNEKLRQLSAHDHDDESTSGRMFSKAYPLIESLDDSIGRLKEKTSKARWMLDQLANARQAHQSDGSTWRTLLLLASILTCCLLIVYSAYYLLFVRRLAFPRAN